MAATQISLTGHCVDWVTPLGLPITQPYHKETTEEVPTPVQNVALTTMFDVTKRPHLAKQKSGFAPNFVHSLDSCHMMLTSVFCQKAGLTFASVHDSYWTHPATVSMMNKVHIIGLLMFMLLFFTDRAIIFTTINLKIFLWL